MKGPAACTVTRSIEDNGEKSPFILLLRIWSRSSNLLGSATVRHSTLQPASGFVPAPIWRGSLNKRQRLLSRSKSAQAFDSCSS
jgi:hypothetical protein